MSTLFDFVKEYPDVDCGMILSAYISCVGGRGDYNGLEIPYTKSAIMRWKSQ